MDTVSAMISGPYYQIAIVEYSGTKDPITQKELDHRVPYGGRMMLMSHDRETNWNENLPTY